MAKKISIIITVLIASGFFLYALIIISDQNKCTWVRTYICENNAKKILNEQKKWIITDTESEIYKKTKYVWDLFLDNCKPIIKDLGTEYSIDYSDCKLKISVFKDKDMVKEIELNWKKLDRAVIDNEFKKKQ